MVNALFFVSTGEPRLQYVGDSAPNETNPPSALDMQEGPVDQLHSVSERDKNVSSNNVLCMTPAVSINLY